MLKWMTRKNPWYCLALALAWLALAVWHLHTGQLLWVCGGFFWAGYNLAFIGRSSTAPDVP